MGFLPPLSLLFSAPFVSISLIVWNLLSSILLIWPYHQLSFLNDFSYCFCNFVVLFLYFLIVNLVLLDNAHASLCIISTDVFCLLSTSIIHHVSHRHTIIIYCCFVNILCTSFVISSCYHIAFSLCIGPLLCLTSNQSLHYLSVTVPKYLLLSHPSIMSLSSSKSVLFHMHGFYLLFKPIFHIFLGFSEPYVTDFVYNGNENLIINKLQWLAVQYLYLYMFT